MASRPASPRSMDKQLTCSICIDLFKNPVTTTCGHSFCKNCLSRSLTLLNTACPLCKNHLNKTPDVNIVLRNITEQMKKQKEEMKKRDMKKFRGKPGQVACDICTKIAATKSCLVCLASYCDDHLMNHSTNKRFKGHKLVQPVEDLDQRACLAHGRPLELYSRMQQKCICVLCMEAGEEGVVSTEDEWDHKKAKLEKTIEKLKKEIEERKTKVDEINVSLKSCKDQLGNEWWNIEAVFSAVIAMVEAAQAKALKPIEDRRQLLNKEASELTDKLQTEVDKLEQTISDLEEISAYDDHILFLQKYPSLKEPYDIKDWTAVELDTSVSFGSMRKITKTMMAQIQLEMDKLTSIELQRLPKFSVDVKLDPSTGHKRLILSSDQKEVIDAELKQEVDDQSERFDIYGSILGSESLSRGRAYWEVEVGSKSGWDLGVASAKANRKGKLTLNPDNGYWAIVHYEGDKYAALTAPPVCLELYEQPQKVGVFLDYDEGLVSFYNVTDQIHLYSFSDEAFTDEIFPYFSPHVKDENNTEPLIISPVKVKKMNY